MTINIAEEGNIVTAAFGGQLDTLTAQQISETIG